MVVEVLLTSKNSSFGIKSIEDGLNQNDVRPTLNKTVDRLCISYDQLIESDIAETRVVYIGRDCRCAVCWAEDTGNKTRTVWCLCVHAIDGTTCNACSLYVDLTVEFFHLIVSHCDSGGVK